MNPALTAVFSSPAPVLSEAAAETIVRKRFNVAGTARRLTSERDCNFLIEQTSGARFVLKFTNPAERTDVTDLQTCAMEHIARHAHDIPVQRIVLTTDGERQFNFTLDDGRTSLVRLMTFLDGEVLNKVERSSAQRRSIGAVAARLSKALRGFFHPAAGYELLWDLKHAPRLLELLDKTEPDRRASVNACLESFAKHVTQVLPTLRAQILQYDFNPSNVLLDAANHNTVAGILDFGDTVHTALVCDLGTAAAYQLVDDGGHPLAPVGEFVAAYHAVVPLEDAEIAVLCDLVMARLAITQLITGWRATLYPENKTYILRNNLATWKSLQRLNKLSRDEAADYLRRACNKTRPA